LEQLKMLAPALNRSLPPPGQLRLYTAPQRDVTRKPAIPDSSFESLVTVESGVLPYYIHYFPEGTHFEVRDAMFKKRPFAYSIFRFASVRVVFAGAIPREFIGRPAIIIGTIEGGEARSSKNIPTLLGGAIIPTKNGKVVLDSAHFLIAGEPAPASSKSEKK
jgi:hypothetical protein